MAKASCASATPIRPKTFPARSIGSASSSASVRPGDRLSSARFQLQGPEQVEHEERSGPIRQGAAYHRKLAVALCGSALAYGLAGAAPASAHPHVFITAREQVLFGPDGKITGIAAAWKFDDMYSAFAIQGLGDPDKILTRDELAPLAKTNVDSLAEFGWFTVGKTGGKNIPFADPVDYWLEEGADKQITLHFTLPLKEPTRTGAFFSLQVYDPTYFVAFDYDPKQPVELVHAPPGCSVSVTKPRPLDNTDSQKLSEAFFTNMSPGADFGIKLAARAIIACP